MLNIIAKKSLYSMGTLTRKCTITCETHDQAGNVLAIHVFKFISCCLVHDAHSLTASLTSDTTVSQISAA